MYIPNIILFKCMFEILFKYKQLMLNEQVAKNLNSNLNVRSAFLKTR